MGGKYFGISGVVASVTSILGTSRTLGGCAIARPNHSKRNTVDPQVKQRRTDDVHIQKGMIQLDVENVNQMKLEKNFRGKPTSCVVMSVMDSVRIKKNSRQFGIR